MSLFRTNYFYENAYIFHKDIPFEKLEFENVYKLQKLNTNTRNVAWYYNARKLSEKVYTSVSPRTKKNWNVMTLKEIEIFKHKFAECFI